MVPEDVRNIKQTVARLEGLLGQDNVTAKLNQAEDEGRPPFDPVTVEEHLGWQQVVVARDPSTRSCRASASR